MKINKTTITRLPQAAIKDVVKILSTQKGVNAKWTVKDCKQFINECLQNYESLSDLRKRNLTIFLNNHRQPPTMKRTNFKEVNNLSTIKP